MNNQKSIEEILAHVRATMHPDVPQYLVQEILRIQIDTSDNDSEARRQLLAAIDKFVKDKGTLHAGTE